jgi:hypothetical protein
VCRGEWLPDLPPPQRQRRNHTAIKRRQALPSVDGGCCAPSCHHVVRPLVPSYNGVAGSVQLKVNSLGGVAYCFRFILQASGRLMSSLSAEHGLSQPTFSTCRDSRLAQSVITPVLRDD